jgi:predicted permease
MPGILLARRWRRRPLYVSSVVVVLALGIGTATAIFSLVEAAILRPLPWRDTDRLVAVYAVSPDRRASQVYANSWNRGQISWPAWRALENSGVFDRVGVWFRFQWTLGYPARGVTEAWYVSSSFLSMLDARPLVGRLFTPEDDTRSADTVVITHAAWQRHFGGRADIIGTPVVLSATVGEAMTVSVVGVLAPGFSFKGEPPEFLLPIGQRGHQSDARTPSHHAIARLAPGITLEAAEAVAKAIVVNNWDAPGTRDARLVSFRDDLTAGTARQLWLLFGGAVVLLLVACGNAAGLVMRETALRRHEFSIRRALGAGRGRQVRDMAVEHALLGSVAAACGLLLAAWLTPLLASTVPEQWRGLYQPRINLAAAAFAGTAGLLTSLGFGTLPVLAIGRHERVLLLAGRAAHAAPSFQQRLLVSAEFALACVLIVAATFFADTLRRLTARPLGFNPSGLVVASLRTTQYPIVAPVAGARMPLDSMYVHAEELLRRLEALPAVESAAVVGSAPFSGRARTIRLRAASAPPEDAGDVQLQSVSGGYFATIRAPLLKGRLFESGDRAMFGARSICVVVSAELERRQLSGAGVGKVLLRDLPGEPPLRYEVIGVVGDVRQRELAEEDVPVAYMLHQRIASAYEIVLRTSGEGVSAALIRDAITGYDPNTLVTAVTPMDSLLARSLADEQFRAVLSRVFGIAALVLAATGLGGLVLRNVTDRSRELAVRVALGARPSQIRGLIARDALLIVGLGMAAGIPAAVAASAFFRSQLYGAETAIGGVLATATAVLTVTALGALSVPAWRAARIDPNVALRD